MLTQIYVAKCLTRPQWVNSSLPGQNGCHFADNIFKCIFVNEKFCILIQISLKFVLKGEIDNKSALVQVFGLAPNRWQAITWTNVDPVHWHIYVALGADELTNWPLRDADVNSISNFQTHIKDRYHEHFLLNCPQVNVTIPHCWLVNIGSSNSFVSSGNKPLPERMLTDLCCHMMSRGHNQLKSF